MASWSSPPDPLVWLNKIKILWSDADGLVADKGTTLRALEVHYLPTEHHEGTVATMNGKQREEYLWSALSGFAAKWSDIMLSPCVSLRALNIEHILIVECVLKRLWGRVQFSAGNLLLNNRRFPICLIGYSLGTAYSLLGTQIWWKRPIPNHVDIKWSENFVP